MYLSRAPPELRYDRFGKNELLFGRDHVDAISLASVLVIGTGGVGSWCVEALCRAGIPRIGLVDCGQVKLSNCSQQICALDSTVGQNKVDVLRQRLLDIHPQAHVVTSTDRVTAEGADEMIRSMEHAAGLQQPATFDVVIDCSDDVNSKAAVAVAARRRGCRIVVVAAGAATRLSPHLVTVGDLAHTQVCPVAKRLRAAVRAAVATSPLPPIPDGGAALRRGLAAVASAGTRAPRGSADAYGVLCVYSTEPPRNTLMTSRDAMVTAGWAAARAADDGGWAPSPMGSSVVVPAMFGLYAAQVAVVGLRPHDGVPDDGAAAEWARQARNGKTHAATRDALACGGVAGDAAP